MKSQILTLSLLIAYSAFSQDYTLTDSGFEVVNAEGIHTQILVYKPDVIRVFKSYHGDVDSKVSYPVIQQPATSGFDVSQDGNIITIVTDYMSAEYDTDKDQIIFYRADGSQLLKEKSSNPTTFTAKKDGDFDSYTVKQAFTIPNSEDLLGLGQILELQVTQRNRTVTLEQANGKVCIPYIVSTAGYGIYWDNYSPTTYKDSNAQTYFESTGLEADYYVLAGDDCADVLANTRWLTGQAPMPPLWNFGLYQSKEKYESASEVRKVVEKYRELNVPLDCVVQDWQYWGTNNRMWNAMDYLNTYYKTGYSRMLETIKENNCKFMISVWSNFGPSTSAFKELDEMGRLIPVETYPEGNGVHPYDCYDAGARDVFWKYLFSGIGSKGLDAVWMDSTEPDFVYSNETEKQEGLNYVTGTGKTWRSLRNAFPLCTNMGVHDHWRNVNGIAGEYMDEAFPQKRVSIMTRSGFLGQQRYGVWTWSGDVVADWSVFAAHIPAAVNFSACGIPYWNSDTGGFFCSDQLKGVTDPAWRRLYMRWCQFSCFCPMMRFHGTYTPREIWQFGEEGDETGDYDQILKYIKLRYRLLPYLYSTAWQVTSNGKSFMNSLATTYTSDSKAVKVNDQYLFGESFLVAPVIKDNVTSRSVYLPNGNDWYNFWTGELLEPGTATFEGEIDQIPLYIPTGTIMPWGPDVQYSTEKPWDNLEVRIYPGRDGSFTLYEDENDGYNYELGQRSTIRFDWNDASQTLTIGTREGEFDGMLNQRTFNLLLMTEENNPADQHATEYTTSVKYDGTEISVKLNGAGISSVLMDQNPADGPIYNLAGQPATSATRGIVIQNGQKRMQ